MVWMWDLEEGKVYVVKGLVGFGWVVGSECGAGMNAAGCNVRNERAVVVEDC